jgi:anti-sigma factor ChrR (cupin superfamily)
VRLNSDFSERAVVRPEDYQWVDSPAPGVERMMFDRIGDEVARATSLVRFAPNSTFSSHAHGGGEEFFVLEGEFADEHRAYPVGTYVRNPIGTEHTPRIGEQGCVIFVKLHQFDKEDDASVVIDTSNAEYPLQLAPGFEAMPLHEFRNELVTLIRWAPNTPFEEHTHHGGEEVYVIEGCFCDEYGDYPAGTWVRYPDQSSHNACTRDEGALLFLKAGHLPGSA